MRRNWVALLTIVMLLAGLSGIAFDERPGLTQDASFMLTMLGYGLFWSGVTTFLFDLSLRMVMQYNEQGYRSWSDIPVPERSAPLVITLLTPLLTVFGVFAVWTHFGWTGENFLTSGYGLGMGVIWIAAGLYPPIALNLLIRAKFEPWCREE